MLSFLICDDEAQVREKLKGYIDVLGKDMGQEVEYREFDSGEALVAAYTPGMADILLVDIQMGALDGVEAVRRIRKTDRDLCVIFITNMIDYAIECYKVRAFGFLRKPLGYEEFRMEMRDAVSFTSKEKDASVTFKSGADLLKIRVRDIHYVETDGHKILLHTTAGPVSIAMSMSEAEKLLPSDFLRCHVSYLVNYARIRQLDYSSLILEDGEVLPISKHRRKAFVEELTALVGEKL